MSKKIPLRRCVGCYEMKEKNLLMRITLNAQNELFLDESGKANGRGAYLCKNSDNCLKQARAKKGLERSFKRQIPAKFLDTV